MKKEVLLTFAALLLCSGAMAKNSLINGDFEQPLENGKFPGWYYNAKRKPYPQLDTAVKKSGKASVMVGNTTTMYAFQQIVARKDMSKFLNGFTISGYMKYENLIKGGKINSQLPFLKLEFSVGKRRVRYPGVMVVRTDTGSKDWFKFEVNYSPADAMNMFKDIPEKNMPTGCTLALYSNRQPGKVWLDDVKLVYHAKRELDITLNSSEFSGDQLEFKFTAAAGKGVEFQVLDNSGKTVVSGKSSGTGKPQNFALSLTAVEAGEYTLSGKVDNSKSAPATVKFQRVADAFAE